MPSRATIPFPASPLLGWFRLTLAWTEMLQASSVVIAHRMERMAAAGPAPGARDRREFGRMVLEKPQAGLESMQAMMLRMTSLTLQQGLRLTQQLAAANGNMMAWWTPAFYSAKGSERWLRRMMGAAALEGGRLSQACASIATHGVVPVRARAAANARRLVYRPAARRARKRGAT